MGGESQAKGGSVMNDGGSQVTSRVYLCKWCRKEFRSKAEAWRHSMVCNMEFEEERDE